MDGGRRLDMVISAWIRDHARRDGRDLSPVLFRIRHATKADGVSVPVVEIVDGPQIVSKPELHYLGIRLTTPFRGMLAVRNALLDELGAWGPGHLFHRLHVIDMNGPMDMEVGLVVPGPRDGDDRVRPGVLPAGRYASLSYVNHARRANKLLLEWARDHGLALDRWDDHFACRYEAFLTDPRTERRKTRWQVELNIRLADG
ncbi:hypothetical protein GCM10027200_35540 [Lentzea nigeriaca]